MLSLSQDNKRAEFFRVCRCTNSALRHHIALHNQNFPPVSSTLFSWGIKSTRFPTVVNRSCYNRRAKSKKNVASRCGLCHLSLARAPGLEGDARNTASTLSGTQFHLRHFLSVITENEGVRVSTEARAGHVERCKRQDMVYKKKETFVYKSTIENVSGTDTRLSVSCSQPGDPHE